MLHENTIINSAIKPAAFLCVTPHGCGIRSVSEFITNTITCDRAGLCAMGAHVHEMARFTAFARYGAAGNRRFSGHLD